MKTTNDLWIQLVDTPAATVSSTVRRRPRRLPRDVVATLKALALR